MSGGDFRIGAAALVPDATVAALREMGWLIVPADCVAETCRNRALPPPAPVLPRVMVGDVLRAAAGVSGFRVDELTGEGQAAALAAARQIGMAVAWHVFGHSLSHVGRVFNRDHSTVRHAAEKFAKRPDPAIQHVAEAAEREAAIRLGREARP